VDEPHDAGEEGFEAAVRARADSTERMALEQVEEQMRAELQHHSVLPASPRRSPSRPQTAPSQRLAFAPGVELSPQRPVERTMMATEYARPYSPSSGSLGSLGGTQRHGLARDVPNRGEVLSLEDITILKLR